MNLLKATSHASTHCDICSTLNSGVVEPWNQQLLDSEHFVVIPSLGSLVEGWLLIVPRLHALSAAALPADLLPELDYVKAQVRQLLEAEYGSPCFFEHGPSACKHQTGCGVDHAHVHAVPGIEDLIGASLPFLPTNVAFRSGNLQDCAREIEKGLDYLYVEHPSGQTWIASHSTFGSQTFRKGIAARLGCPDRFNWRAFPEIHNIDSTIARLGAQGVFREVTSAWTK